MTRSYCTSVLVCSAAALLAAGCSKKSSGSALATGNQAAAAAIASGVAALASGTPAAAGGAAPAAAPTPPVPPLTPEGDPPQVTLSRPARGQFVTTQQVLVEGDVQDQSGLAYFLVDGLPVQPDPSGHFVAPVSLQSGLNVITIEAADPWANRTQLAVPVISGSYLPETSQVPDAVAVRLNRTAFDAIERLAAAQLGGANLAQTILAQNPLYSGGGSAASVAVNATTVRLGTPRLDLDPRQGGLFVRAELPAIDITVRANGRLIGIPYSLTTQVTATLAVVEATAQVTVAQGQVTTQLVGTNVDLQGFRFDINNVPGFLEALARNAVRRLIEREVRKQVEQVVPRELNRAIAGANGPIQQTVLGRPVALHLVPTAVDFDPDGASVRADGDFVVGGGAATGLPTSPGSFSTPGTPPVHPTQGGKSIYAAADDDFLNRISHAAWRGGLLSYTVDQAAAARLGLPSWLQLDAFLLQVFFPSLTALNPSDPLEIEVRAQTPAIFQTRPAPGLLEAGLGDLSLAFYVAPPGRPRQLVLEVGVQARAEVGVRVQGGLVRLDLVGRPLVVADVFQTPLAPLDTTAVENLVGFVAPPLLQLYARTLSGFPLPTTPGITLNGVDVHADGPAGDYVTIEGDL